MIGAEGRIAPGLRNPHLQSVLSSSRLRRVTARAAVQQLRRGVEERILDSGAGVRLQGFLSRQRQLPRARGLVLLLHGWEGRADSNYMLHTGGALLAAGFDVFRLNFRDHGGTQGLNVGLFHSCRIDEVVGAARALAGTVPHRRLAIAGYSLGGNFALRVALRAPAAGLALHQVVAVSPVICPRASLTAIEAAPWFYEHYFMRKWRRSLARKQALFPGRYRFSRAELHAVLRELTRILVERHTRFGTLGAYLDGYSIAGDRLAGLQVPASILTAADDPVIPVADFHALQRPPGLHLVVARHGGHCGFIRDWRLHGLAEDWVRARLVEGSPA